MSHIYETAQAGWANWAEDQNQQDFYQILQANKDKILIEVTGHDHLSDFRTHSADQIFNKDDECLDTSRDEGSQYFLGKIISPSVTPGSDTQPGYTTFTYTEDSQQLEDVTMTFLQLESAEGLDLTAQ